VCSPGVVLADEPTGNLDAANGGKLQLLMRSLCGTHGQAFVIATHSESLAQARTGS